MRRIIPIAVALVISLPAAAVEPPVHTYSIVARDAATGEMGVAVQSHWFSVGSIVTWYPCPRSWLGRIPSRSTSLWIAMMPSISVSGRGGHPGT